MNEQQFRALCVPPHGRYTGWLLNTAEQGTATQVPRQGGD